jgi:curved DNA-binding protein CbpA
MSASPDYYEALQVSPNADGEVIQAAYNRLVEKWHAERTLGDPSAFGRLSHLDEAYAALSDPLKRQEYDARRRKPATSGMARDAPSQAMAARQQHVASVPNSDLPRWSPRAESTTEMQQDVVSAAWGSGPYSRQQRGTDRAQQQAASSSPPLTATSLPSKSGREPKKIDQWAALAFILIVGGFYFGLTLDTYGPSATAQVYAVALVRSFCLSLLLAGVGVLVRWLTKKKGNGQEHSDTHAADKPAASQYSAGAEKAPTINTQNAAQRTNDTETHRLDLLPRASEREVTPQPTGGSSQVCRQDLRGRFAAAAAAAVIGYVVLGLILPPTVAGLVFKMVGGIAIGVGLMRLAKAATWVAASYRAELFWITLLVADGFFGVADAINNSSVFQPRAEVLQHQTRGGLTIAEEDAAPRSANPDDYPTLKPYEPGTAGAALGLAPSGWSDQTIPVEARIESFIRVKRQYRDTWAKFSEEAKSLFGINPEKFRRRYEMEVAREIVKNNLEPLHLYLIRRSIPFVSAYVNLREAQDYKAARERFDQGKATGADVGLIANYERLQEIARGRRPEGDAGTQR